MCPAALCSPDTSIGASGGCSTKSTRGLLVARATSASAAATSASSWAMSASAARSRSKIAPSVVMRSRAACDVVVVGQQQDGHAGVAQLRDDLGRAGLLVADDEAGVLGQHRLGREEPVVAEVGLLLERLGRVEAGGVDGGDLVLGAEGVDGLGEDAAEGGHAVVSSMTTSLPSTSVTVERLLRERRRPRSRPREAGQGKRREGA